MKKPFLIFKGSQQHPFLSPRGIFVCNGKLLVSDTANNQIYIWHTIPQHQFQEPDIVLGNKTHSLGADTLYYPSGLWTNGKKLIVADAWNHRVLIWHTFPTHHFTPADVVLGQSSFEENLPNVLGVGASANASSLYWCYGVFSDGHSLWVADSGNRRVLYFEKIPEQNFSPADQVIGQTSFTAKDFNPQNATWPYAIKISPHREMLISDTQCFRVLYWKDWRQSIQHSADGIIGQPDLSSNGQNRFQSKPSEDSLNWCYDAIFDEGRGKIFVADTGNSRILQFSHIYPQHIPQMPKAEKVYGQRGFDEIGENRESIMGVEGFIYWAFGIAIEDNTLFVCETGNNRIDFYHIED